MVIKISIKNKGGIKFGFKKSEEDDFHEIKDVNDLEIISLDESDCELDIADKSIAEEITTPIPDDLIDLIAKKLDIFSENKIEKVLIPIFEQKRKHKKKRINKKWLRRYGYRVKYKECDYEVINIDKDATPSK